MRPPRLGEVWTAGTEPASRTALVISSTVYKQDRREPTVLVALVTEHATDEEFCVDLGEGQWAVTGLVTFVAKASLVACLRRVDTQTLTNADNLLFRILATPKR